MLHASETWPLTKTNLQRNDRAVIRQICFFKPEDVVMVRSNQLLAKLEGLNLIVRERRLCWSGHVDLRTACDIQINWGRKTTVSGSSQQLTLKIGAGDQTGDLQCVQLVSYLEGGPLKWMMPKI